MRTTADFIASTKKRARATEFACYVRNMTASAVRLSIPFGTVEQAPKMTAAALAEITARNRARYTADCDQSRPNATGPDHSRPVTVGTEVSSAATSAAPAADADDWRS